ncbi:MAG: cysteine desulfurase family protein [Parvibaculaceae bacterium]
MLGALDCLGNPSSVHAEGRRARDLIEEAREAIEAFVSAPARSVVFTSGGTEANNLALLGAPAERLIVSAVEHPSVLEAARRSGKPVTVLPVDSDGIVDLSALDRALAEGGRALVSVMLANNETGAIQPIAEVVKLARRHGALVHTDAVQAAGKIEVSFEAFGVDLMSLSAHKLGGPAGVGALVLRDGLDIEARQLGGGQEFRRRAGTENVAGIAGFGAAVKAAARELPEASLRMSDLRASLEAALAEGPDRAHIFAKGAKRLPNTSCLAVRGLDAALLLMGLDLEGIAVSSGSACSSGKVAASHVLDAMGVEPELARGAIRLSLGWNSTAEDVGRFISGWRTFMGRMDSRRAA